MLTTNFVATHLLLDVIPSLLDGSLYSLFHYSPRSAMKRFVTCETSHIHLHALYVVSEDNLQITPISKLWPVADLTLYVVNLLTDSSCAPSQSVHCRKDLMAVHSACLHS